MAFEIKSLPHKDILAHVVDKKPDNYFDEEVEIFFDGVLPGGDVTKSYVDLADEKTLADAKSYTDAKVAEVSGAKLYNEFGENTDGSITQKVISDKIEELEQNIDTNASDILVLDEQLSKEVQLDTNVSSTASTVTLTKSRGSINATGQTDTDIALPVASETQAGVMNAATYKTVQDNTELIQSILQGAVSIIGLPENPTQEELTTAWKSATSETELINRASIFDSTNNKIWYYYANVQKWQATKSDGGSVTIEQATNTSLGIVKGSTEVGQISVETDGSMSVNGFDELSTKVNNTDTRTSNLPTQVVYNTSIPEYKENEVDLTLIVKDLHTGGDASLPLNIMGATSTKAGVMTAADKSKLGRIPQTVVSAAGIRQTSDDKKTSILVKYKNVLTGEAYNDVVEIPVVSSQYNGLITPDQNTKLGDLAYISTIGDGLKLNNHELIADVAEPTAITEEEFNNIWENA